MSEPLHLCLRIIELRQYARVKAQVEAARTDAQMPKGPLANLAFEFEAEQARAGKIRFT